MNPGRANAWRSVTGEAGCRRNPVHTRRKKRSPPRPRRSSRKRTIENRCRRGNPVGASARRLARNDRTRLRPKTSKIVPTGEAEVVRRHRGTSLFRRSRAHQSNPLRRVDLCSASEREDEYVRRCQALPAGRTGRARHNTSGRPHGKQPRPRRPRFRSIRETCR